MGLRTSSESVWQVVVHVHGFGAFDSIEIVDLPPGVRVIGPRRISRVGAQGETAFVVAIPRDVDGRVRIKVVGRSGVLRATREITLVSAPDNG